MRHRPHWLLFLFLGACARESGDAFEVRQLVYFDFLPGRTGEAIQLFRDEALPLYQRNEPMLRFRGYREAESPESFDLVVVSTFEGMSGMDASNEALAGEARARGTSVGGIYGRISALSSGHRDEFVEIAEALSWGEIDGAKLVALVSIRLAPGTSEAYETLLRSEILPWERKRGRITGSETGRFLVSGGYSYFRMVGLSSLSDWQDYAVEERRQPFAHALDQSIAESRQILVAPVAELSVR
jgi:hypothetical protein